MKLARCRFLFLLLVVNLSYLLNGMEPDEDDYPSRYPLHFFVSVGRETEVKEFLRSHDINSHDDVGCTPLHIAVRKQQATLVDLLLKNNAHIDVVDENGAGSTPLGGALSLGDEKIIKKLLKKKASPRTVNSYGWSPLHTAAVFDTSPKMLKSLYDHGADPLARGPARRYLANEWVEIITDRFVQQQEYYQELVELATHKEKDLFYEKTKSITNSDKRQQKRNELEDRLVDLEKQKSLDELRCSIALYHLLLYFPCELSGDGQEIFCTAQEWSNLVMMELYQRTNYWGQPSYDWNQINEWADKLMQELRKPESLPNVPNLDWQTLRNWLQDNRANILRRKLTGKAQVVLDEAYRATELVQKYLEKMQQWDLVVTTRKINDQLCRQWCGYVIDVIIGQNIGEFFQMPDKQWSVKEFKDWTLRVRRAARLSKSGEYLIVPFFNFESPYLLDAIKSLREVVRNKLVDAVLVLPPESDAPMREWVDKVARDFTSSSSSERSNSSDCVGDVMELLVVSEKETARLSDKKWLRDLRKRGQEVLQKGFLIAGVIDKEKIGQTLQLVKEKCGTYDCNILIAADIFSGSLLPESTRARLKEVSPELKVEEVVNTDKFSHPLKRDRLVITGDAQSIGAWLQYLQDCIDANKQHVEHLKKAFAAYRQKELAQIPVLELLKKKITVYLPPTFKSILLVALLEMHDDIDPTDTKFEAQDWADRVGAALQKKLAIDARPFLYYLLSKVGLNMKINDKADCPLLDWVTLLEGLPNEILPEKVKVFLERKVKIYTHDCRDGHTPFEVSGANDDSWQKGGGIEPLVHDVEPEIELSEKSKLIKKYEDAAVASLYNDEKKGAKEFAKIIKAYNVDGMFKKIKSYKAVGPHASARLKKYELTDILSEFRIHAFSDSVAHPGGMSDDQPLKSRETPKLRRGITWHPSLKSRESEEAPPKPRKKNSSPAGSRRRANSGGNDGPPRLRRGDSWYSGKKKGSWV